MVDEKEREDRRKLGQELKHLGEFEGQELAAVFQQLLRENARKYLLSKDGLSFLEFVLIDEATRILSEGMKLAVTAPVVRTSIGKAQQRAAGKKSGDARAKSGTKYRFLVWALELNKANPGLSKNDIAERYARLNPGTSVTTLRRYLADVRSVAGEGG